jgi:hypothetical protein
MIIRASLLLSVLLIFSVISVFAEQNVTTCVSADVLSDTYCEEVIGIQVSPNLSLGNVTRGSDGNSLKVYINNTGTVNLTITPILQDSNEKIFSYLYFQRRTTESWRKLGNWSLNLSRATPCGAINDDYFYMKLDLRNYPTAINNHLFNYKTNLTFWAMPQ